MKRTILYCCITAIPLFILSFIFNGFIYEQLLSFFYSDSINFQVTHVNNFNSVLLLSLAIGLIPVFILLSWQLGHIDSLIKKVLSLWVVGICISAAFTANAFRILSKQIPISEFKIPLVYPLEELYLEYVILAGTLIGCGVTFLVFRKKEIGV